MSIGKPLTLHDHLSFGVRIADRSGRGRLPRLAAGAAVLLSLQLFACSGPDDPSPTRDPDQPPHVLLISIDSLRADHLSCYGRQTPTGEPTSPRLDALAEQGVLFERCVSTTSWTLPAHHALLSGLPDMLHGVSNHYSGPSLDRVCLPEALQDADWQTAGFYSGPYLHPAFGFGQGFPEHRYVNCGAPSMFDLPEDDPNATANLSLQSWRQITSEQVSDGAIEFLQMHAEDDTDDPFFLFLHYFDVHYDYDPQPETWAKRFWPDYRRPPINGVDFIFNDRIHADMDPDALEGVLSYYDGEIAWVDHQIGRVLDALEDLGLDLDTLVVITADHGDEFFEHGNKGHRQNLYQETLHVPLIVRLPGAFEGGERVPTRVSLIDVAPTILDLTGVTPTDAVEHPLLHKGMLGRSLLPLVQGEETGDRDQIGLLTDIQDDEATGRSHHWALWSGDLKVVVTARWDEGGMHCARSVEGEIYDLGDDPGETRNLARTPDRDALAAIRRHEELHAQLYQLTELFRAGPPPSRDSEHLESIRSELRALGYLEPAEDGLAPEGMVSAQPPPRPFPRDG